jgi:hypothetical protein
LGGNYYKCLITESPFENPEFIDIGSIPIEICGLCLVVSKNENLFFLISGRNDDTQEILVLSASNKVEIKTLLSVTDTKMFLGTEFQFHTFQFRENGVSLDINTKIRTDSADHERQSRESDLALQGTIGDLTNRLDLTALLTALKPNKINFPSSLKLQFNIKIVKV